MAYDTPAYEGVQLDIPFYAKLANQPLPLNSVQRTEVSFQRMDLLTKTCPYSSHTTHFLEVPEINLEFGHLIPLRFLA